LENSAIFTRLYVAGDSKSYRLNEAAARIALSPESS